jgi:hypothetical protein
MPDGLPNLGFLPSPRLWLLIPVARVPSASYSTELPDDDGAAL